MSPFQSLIAAFKSGAWVSVIATLATAGVTFGVLTSEQAGAVNGVVSAVVTVISAVVAAVHTFHLARAAKVQQALKAQIAAS